MAFHEWPAHVTCRATDRAEQTSPKRERDFVNVGSAPRMKREVAARSRSTSAIFFRPRTSRDSTGTCLLLRAAHSGPAERLRRLCHRAPIFRLRRHLGQRKMAFILPCSLAPMIRGWNSAGKTAKIAERRPLGEIGRHARFRILSRKGCRFKSGSGHSLKKRSLVPRFAAWHPGDAVALNSP